MNNTAKQLSNPFSTGGGGPNFETDVQAAFVALMLTGGFAPCLPCWPITKIKLQGKYAGYDTDDLIVFVKAPNGGQKRKMLCQIKHKVGINKDNKKFGEVIQAAWEDFNNPDIFEKGKDVFALITGPLSATDIDSVRIPILEKARHSENSSDFITKIEKANFTSKITREKLKAFRAQLKIANDNNDVSDDDLFNFLRHFHLLGYDLDIKSGVIQSLLHSLIGQNSTENVEGLWGKIVVEVRDVNQNAGTLTLDSIPDEIKDAFKKPVQETIPPELVTTETPVEKTDWNQSEYAAELAVFNLLGSWSEKTDG